jgi:hypothetical protein
MNASDSQIDSALDSYPLVPLPPRFIQRTMARIHPRPRFHLEFLDLALPAFIILFGTIVTSLVFWLINTLNPLWMLELQVRAHWYAQNLNALPWGLLAVVWISVIGASSLAGLMLILAFDRPLRPT